MVQGLRFLAPKTEGPGSIPGWGTRSHTLQLRVCLPHLKTPQAATQITDPRSHVPQLRPGVQAQSLSRVQLFATLWTVAHQAPLSMRFSRQEYWTGLPFPPPGDLPDPGILCLLHWQCWILYNQCHLGALRPGTAK